MPQRSAVALAALFVLGAAGWFAATHAYSLYDDAYIYFRYVDNVWRGCGLRWNCTDGAVEGFTSPLYLALLVGGRAFTTDLETIAVVLGALLLVMALVATVILAARLGGGGAALLTALLVATDGYVLLSGTIGLETSLACAMVAIVALVVATERRGWPLVAATVLAVLCRPELGVLVVALPLVAEPRRVAQAVVALVAITAIRYAIFGQLLPNTFYAKTGGTTAHLRLGAAYLVELATDFPLVLAAPLALRLEAARRLARYLLVASALAFAFFLYSGGDTFLYSRLAMPLLPTLCALAIVGLLGLRETRWVRALAAALVFAVAVRGALTHAIPEQHGFDNVARWRRVGTWLREHIAREHSIATVPIGAIGWTSQLRLLDLVGLVTPEVAHGGRVPPERLTRTWIGHEKHNTAFVLAQAPDVLVFTKWQDHPWTVADAKAGFWAEWLLLQAIRDGSAPYRVLDAEVAPGVYWLMFERATVR